MTTWLFATLFIIISFAALHLMEWLDWNKWIGVSVGGGAFIVLLILTLWLRKKFFLHPYVFAANGFACGMAASSLFTHIGAFPPLWQTALLAVGLSAAFGLFCLFTLTPLFKKHYVICALLFFALLITAEILGAVYGPNEIFYLALLYLTSFIGFAVSLAMESETVKRQFKNVTYCSFAVLLIVVIVVLLILSGGDGLDGLDGFDISFGGGGSKKPKSNADIK